MLVMISLAFHFLSLSVFFHCLFLQYVDSRQQGTFGHDGENPGTSSSTHDHTEQVGGVEKFTVCQTKTIQAQLTMKRVL